MRLEAPVRVRLLVFDGRWLSGRGGCGKLLFLVGLDRPERVLGVRLYDEVNSWRIR